MTRSKRAGGAKRGTDTRSKEEILASMQEIFDSLGEELNVEEWLRLDAPGLEDRLMELLVRAKARLTAGPVERAPAPASADGPKPE